MEEILQTDRSKILYVDDDEHTLNVVSTFLEKKGYEIITSSLPFITSTLKDKKPDLLIIDIDMPSISGQKLVEILKNSWLSSGMKFIYFSGKPVDVLVKAVKETGADGFVKKADGLEALLRKIRLVLTS